MRHLKMDHLLPSICLTIAFILTVDSQVNHAVPSTPPSIPPPPPPSTPSLPPTTPPPTPPSTHKNDCAPWCKCSQAIDGIHMACVGHLPWLNGSLLNTTSLTLKNIRAKNKALKMVFDQTCRLKKLVIHEFDIAHMAIDIFTQLSKLATLDLRRNIHITDIHKDVFHNLVNLRKLRVSAMPNLPIPILQKALHSIRSHRIDTLVLDSLQTSSLANLTASFFQPFKNSKLITVVLANLGIARVTAGFTRYIKGLTCLDASGNPLTASNSEVLTEILLLLPELRTANLNGIFPKEPSDLYTELDQVCAEPLPNSTEINHLDPLWINKTKQRPPECPTISASRNLRFISIVNVFNAFDPLSKANDRACFDYHNHVRYFDFHNDKLQFKLGLYGFLRLQYINLQATGMDAIRCQTFCDMPSLTTMLLGGNNLHSWFDTGNATYALRNLTHLSSIDLADCNIYKISLNDFQTLSQIRLVNLSNNKLSVEALNHTINYQVEFLNISGNTIKYLPQKFTQSLGKAIWKFKNKIPISNRGLKLTEFFPVIDLSGNPLECSCASLPFILWFQAHIQHFYAGSNYSCILGSDVTLLVNIKKSDLGNCNAQKHTPFPLVATVSGITGALFMILLTSFLSYRYKRQLKYYLYFLPYIHIYTAIYKVNKERYTQLDEESADQFDVFILCSSDDINFVVSDIKPGLVERGFRVTIGEEDFTPGQSIPQEIERSLEASTCALLILSNHFLCSPWLDYEVTMAIAMRRKVIIVKLDDPPHRLMPPALIYLYRRNETRPRYPTNRPQDLPNFWNKLTGAIMQMKTPWHVNTSYRTFGLD